MRTCSSVSSGRGLPRSRSGEPDERRADDRLLDDARARRVRDRRDASPQGRSSSPTPRRSDRRSRGSGSPLPRGTRRRTARARTACVQSACGQSSTMTTSTPSRRRLGDELLVLGARIAGDDVHEHFGVRWRRVRADDDRARLGTGAELLARAARRACRVTTIGPARGRRDLLAQREAEAARLGRERASRCDLTDPPRPSSPRAWMPWSTPMSTRFATIDEPPTVTNGSGMPVTGATPIVMPTFTNTWKRNATTRPARDDDAVEIARAGDRPGGRARRRGGRGGAGSRSRRSRAARASEANAKSVACSGR